METDTSVSSWHYEFNSTPETSINRSDDPFVSIAEIPSGPALLGLSVGVVSVAMGVFGNGLVVTAILKCQHLRTRKNVFFISLAVFDLFQTLCVRPLQIYTYAAGRWLLGDSACLYLLYASNLAILASILHVSVIAFYRYAILLHPNAARHLRKSWMVALLLLATVTLPVLVVLCMGRLRSQHPAELVFDTRIMFCTVARISSFHPTGILKKALFLTLTALFLVYCYLRIYVKVRHSGKQFNQRNPSLTAACLNRELALLKTLLVVFFAFVTSYLPVTVLYALGQTHDFPYILYVISVLLLWMSSSVNWMIYGLMNQQFRKGYRLVLRRLPAKSDTGVTGNVCSSRLSGRESASGTL